ncbi:MAG: cytochrome c maturation protein CcmE [Candidatus Accumulibacter propinquus]
MRFVVTDTDKDMTVAYKGILPDLFREGKGVVAQGKLGDDGVFAATKCSPSTTRTTCRRKPPRRSATRTSAQRPTRRQRSGQPDHQAVTRTTRHDPGTRQLRAHPRALRRPGAGHTAADRRPHVAGSNGWRWRVRRRSRRRCCWRWPSAA